MKIRIVSCVFHPEPLASARTSGDIARAMVNSDNVTQVITTFPNRPAGKIYDGFQRRFWTRDRSIGGFEIIRVFSFFSSQSNLFSRLLENFSFGVAGALAVLFLEKPDVIYANTWPIFAQGLLMLACKMRRIPLVLSIQDLYPESLFVQKRGFEKTSRLYRLLHWLDEQIAQKSSFIIVISEKFKEIYIHDRHVPEGKIAVIPNWIDDIKMITTSTSVDIRKIHNIPTDAFLVVYGGNIGAAAGVEQLIEAFHYLPSQENIYLLLAGAGSNLSNCMLLIEKYQLERVIIHSPWLTPDTYTILSTADLCVLPTQGEQSLVSVPSKILSYMLAGRCVLAVASPSSEAARVITDSQAGWVISTNDPISLSGQINDISKIPADELNRRGQAGRSFVLKNFSAREHLSKVIELIVQHGKSRE